MFVQRAKRGGGREGCMYRSWSTRTANSIDIQFRLVRRWSFDYVVVTLLSQAAHPNSWRSMATAMMIREAKTMIRGSWRGGGGCEGWIEWRTRHESISFDPSSTDKPVNRGSMRESAATRGEEQER